MEKHRVHRSFWDQELIFELMGRLPRALVMLICLGGVVGVAVVDYLTQEKASIYIFYAVPISIAAWVLGTRYGLAVSFLSSAAWVVTDYYVKRGGATWTLPYWNACVLLAFFCVFALLIARLRHTMHREKQMSRTDPLTGACNIRCFYERAEVELERSRRYGRPFSLAYLDVDNFKQVNDNFGHTVGDELLRSMSEAVMGHIRESDILARLGGDEFCVLFPEAGEKEALSAMEKLRQEMIAAFPAECREVCSFSVGLVTFNQPPATVEEIVQITDHLMYEVKNSTKDAIATSVYP